MTLLLKHLPPDIEPSVVLFEDGEFAQRMRDCGYPTTVTAVAERLRAIPRERPSSAAAIVALPQAVRALAQFLHKSKVDAVHTNTVKAHFIAAPAARLCGIRSIIHLRDMLEGTGRNALRGIALTCSRERIAISRALADWYGMPHTTIISNPVDLSAYDSVPERSDARRALGIPADDLPLIGIVGRINRWKGHDRFLRIAALVNERRPIRCAIVGEARFRDADFVPELHALAERLGIAERTTFVPWLDDPRLAFAALDVHCNCSQREPFGRSIVEAAAAGVPTVAFDDGGATDIIANGVDGRLIAAGDEAAFAAAILEYVTDATIHDAAAVAARSGSRRFAAETHAQRVADVLRKTIA